MSGSCHRSPWRSGPAGPAVNDVTTVAKAPPMTKATAISTRLPRMMKSLKPLSMALLPGRPLDDGQVSGLSGQRTKWRHCDPRPTPAQPPRPRPGGVPDGRTGRAGSRRAAPWEGCGNPGELSRFVSAQDGGDTYAAALSELREGRKRTHWMWFVFPQIAGLGRSQTAQRYAISGLDEGPGLPGAPRAGAPAGRVRPRVDDAAHLRSGGRSSARSTRRSSARR